MQTLFVAFVASVGNKKHTHTHVHQMKIPLLYTHTHIHTELVSALLNLNLEMSGTWRRFQLFSIFVVDFCSYFGIRVATAKTARISWRRLWKFFQKVFLWCFSGKTFPFRGLYCVSRLIAAFAAFAPKNTFTIFFSFLVHAFCSLQMHTTPFQPSLTVDPTIEAGRLICSVDLFSCKNICILAHTHLTWISKVGAFRSTDRDFFK